LNPHKHAICRATASHPIIDDGVKLDSIGYSIGMTPESWIIHQASLSNERSQAAKQLLASRSHAGSGWCPAHGGFRGKWGPRHDACIWREIQECGWVAMREIKMNAITTNQF